MKNNSAVAAFALIAVFSAGNSSAAGSNEDFIKAARTELAKPAEVAPPAGAPVTAQAPTAPLTDGQYSTLIGLATKIRQCPVYTLNYGRNKPYEEGCVELLVRSALQVYASFLPNSGPVIRDMSRILKCPTYSVNYGRNKPYEEGCVDNLVEVVVGHLQDQAKAAADARNQSRKFLQPWK